MSPKQLSIAIIHTDNTIEVGQYPAALKDLQRFVGGLIQPILLSHNGNIMMLVNEEGKLQLEPKLNQIATMMFELAYGFGEDYVVGDAVVLGTAGEEFGDLTKEGFEMITKATVECQRRARI